MIPSVNITQNFKVTCIDVKINTDNCLEIECRLQPVCSDVRYI